MRHVLPSAVESHCKHVFVHVCMCERESLYAFFFFAPSPCVSDFGHLLRSSKRQEGKKSISDMRSSVEVWVPPKCVYTCIACVCTVHKYPKHTGSMSFPESVCRDTSNSH